MGARSALALALQRLVRGGSVVQESTAHSFRQPVRKTLVLSNLPASTTTGRLVDTGEALQLTGRELYMPLHGSHASALIEVAFDLTEPNSAQWIPMGPGTRASKPDGSPFVQVYLRRQSATPSSANTFQLLADENELGSSVVEEGRFAQVSASGNLQNVMEVTTLGGTEVPAIASDEGALAISGWTGAAYVRALISAAGRLAVNLIVGQDGITAGAGAVAANTPRVTHASDDPIAAATTTDGGTIPTRVVLVGGHDGANAQTIATDTGGRVSVNPISGQAGVQGAAGAATALTQRTTESVPNWQAPTQVAVDSSADLVCAARTKRKSVLLLNAGAVTCYVGKSGVTTADGFPLAAGAGMVLTHGEDVYAVTAASSTTVAVSEEYDS